MLCRLNSLMLFSFIVAHGFTNRLTWQGGARNGRGFKKAVYMATSVATPANVVSDIKKRMPITVLSGFLGSGKTTFLQRALENDKGMKFGLLINDMASVNVDSKLIKKSSSGFDSVETLELQNGCVCCTLAEDLIVSVSKLVELADSKNVRYDHIIVECSGIAEPRKIRELFQAAEDYGDQLMDSVVLDSLVTIVDASTFLRLFGTDADLKSHSALAVSEGTPENPLGSMSSAANQLDDTTGMRKITDLLLEQVECADTVLINKIDLLPRERDVEIVTKVVKSMNPNSRVLSCVRGDVDPTLVVGVGKGTGAASQGILDEHRNLVSAIEKGKELGSKHGEVGHVCDSSCSEHNHEHSHGHDHTHASSPAHGEAGHVCDATCDKIVEDHGHSHDHDHTGDTCTHPSHSHSHDHGVCNDPTHDHGHTHEHSSATTAETRFGITSFVYRRRRPFHPARFTTFLQSIGKLSVQGLTDYVAGSDEENENRAKLLRTEGLETAKRSLLRSKGFVWMATSAAGAYFMSHAGQYLELVVLGRWWADIQPDEWPEGSKEEILKDFEGSHGDRRQELVFIGQFDEDVSTSGKSQKSLVNVLDSCLLTDEEMKKYEEISPKGDQALRTLFFKST